jgi:O-antigen/teichoic acid export membrane protein
MNLQRKTITDYVTITSGVLGRLAISVVYFLIIANVLTLGEFGVFASASAVGLVLSRVMAFGFMSPVYRVATVKPRLLGAYVGGLIAFTALSLPFIFALAVTIHFFFFDGRIALPWFLLIIACEVIGWRIIEYVVIVLNGLSRFGKAALLVITGSLMRTVAAIAFLLLSWRGLETWTVFYCAANVATLAVALLWFVPRMRLRFVWRIYPRRMKDAVTAAFSELTFYIQSELDKLLVLGMAGDKTAGLYAIAMRFIDLTAIPVRSFNQMLVQHLMKDGEAMADIRLRTLVEVAIAAISTAGMAAFIILLWLYPALLGHNVAEASVYLLPMLAIPALRNLIEYQGELLYAREKVVSRAGLLAVLAILKLSMMASLLSALVGFAAWALPLTAVYVLLYAVSVVWSYRALGHVSR